MQRHALGLGIVSAVFVTLVARLRPSRACCARGALRTGGVSWALIAAAGVPGLALWATGCGGGGGGSSGNNTGGGSPSPSPSPSPSASPVASLGETWPIRADIRTGVSVPAVSLQDQKTHDYDVPSVAGETFTVTIDTQPSHQSLELAASEYVASGSPTTQTATITTPFTTTFSASTTQDSVIIFGVFDPFQLGLTLSSLTVKANQSSSNTTSFTAFVHICGDSFSGFSATAGNGPYNDLATSADQQKFVADLLNGFNTVWAPVGVQINVGASGFSRLTSAQVQAVDPSLVQGGLTILDVGTSATTAPARAWGNLGIDASDPTYGLAVDIFVVQASASASGGSTPAGDAAGFACQVGGFLGQGGVFAGKGTDHAVILALAGSSGTSYYSMQELQNTIAHELGHFLSLGHTTKISNFQPSDIADCPSSTVANDTDKNGMLDDGDDTSLMPDVQNLMFPFGVAGVTQAALTQGQGQAAQAYLSIRQH